MFTETSIEKNEVATTETPETMDFPITSTPKNDGSEDDPMEIFDISHIKKPPVAKEPSSDASSKMWPGKTRLAKNRKDHNSFLLL